MMTFKVKFSLFLSVTLIITIITVTILNTGTTLYNTTQNKTATITNEVKAYDDLYEVVERSSRDIIKYNDIIDDRVERIKNMTLKKLNSTIKSIDFNNLSVVRMERKEN